MNAKVTVVVLALITLLMAGAGGMWLLRMREVPPEQLRLYYEQLASDDARQRLSAAHSLIDAGVNGEEVVLTGAEAANALNRCAEARELISRARLDRNSKRALRVMIDSFLREADVELSSTTKPLDEMAADRVLAMLSEITPLRSRLATVSDSALVILLIEARMTEIRAEVAHRQLLQVAHEIERSRALVSLGESYEKQIRRHSALEEHARQLELELVGLCDRITELDPDAMEPHVFRFGHHVRTGELTKARAAAAQIVQRKQVDGRWAGQVAQTLANLTRHARIDTTQADIALAERLISHPGLVNSDHFNCQRARYDVAMHQRRYEDAVELARALDEQNYPDGPAITALALAHAGLKRVHEVKDLNSDKARAGRQMVEDAMVILRPRLEEGGSAAIHYAAGVAALARNDHRRARQALRRAIELDPQNIKARFLLCDSYASTGDFLEAEGDVRATLHVAPNHRRAQLFYARLLFEKNDEERIHEIVAGTREQPLEFDADLASLYAAVGMDDVPFVIDWLERDDHDDLADMRVSMARAWLRLAPEARAKIGAILIRAARDRVVSDHLYRLSPPDVPSLRRQRLASNGAGGPAFDQTVLVEHRFVPTPCADSAELLAIAAQRWSSDARLTRQAFRALFLARRFAEARRWAALIETDDHPVEAAVVALLNGSPDKATDLLAKVDTKDDPTVQMLRLMIALNGRDPASLPTHVDSLLQAHPWSFDAMLTVTQVLMAQDKASELAAVDAVCKRHNPKLAELIRARRLVAEGHADQAWKVVDELMRGESQRSQVRRWAADSYAMACAAADRFGPGRGNFETLSVTFRQSQPELVIASIDMTIEAGENSRASSVLVRLMSDAETDPRWLDELLLRAESIVSAESLRKFLLGLSLERPEVALFKVYRARMAMREGNNDKAEEHLLEVYEGLKDSADGPRILLRLAELNARMGRTDKARDWYKKLEACGGPARLIARQALGDLEETNTPDQEIDRPSPDDEG